MKNEQLKLRKISIINGLLLLFLLVGSQVLYASTDETEANKLYEIQQRKITLKLSNETLKDILYKMQDASGISFVISEEAIPSSRRLFSLDVKDVSVEKALKQLLVASDLTYALTENNVTILKNKQQKQSVETIVIKGKVVDQDNNAVPGATVILKGVGNLGVSSNENGEFSLTVPRTDKIVLVVSFVGMKTKEVEYKGEKSITVKLENSVEEMQEVVVTGIFNRPRESYTGSVTSITNKELKTFRGQNVLKTLANIDPAFTIVQDNLAGSNPNREMEITIRGQSSLPTSLNELNSTEGKRLNTPLVILDGFEISMTKLMDFDDEEIESINILKDASATAIYGSRGANGVVVVTTKEPVAGKLKVSFQGGVNLEIPELSSYNLMNAKEKLEFEKNIGLYDSKDLYKDSKLKARYNEYLSGTLRGETDWLREPVRVGVGQRLNLRIEGGSKEFRWGVSVANNKTTGTMKGSVRNNFSASITLTYDYKTLRFKNIATYETNKSDLGSYGNYSTYAALNPYFRAKDTDGELIKSWKNSSGEDIYNPLYDATLDIKNYSNTSSLRNTFSLDWRIGKGFSAMGQFSITKGNNTKDYYLPAEHSRFKNETDFFKKGSYDYTTGQNNSISGNFSLNYSKSIRDKHLIYGGLYVSIDKKDSYSYYFKTVGILNPNFTDLGNALAYAENSSPSGSDSRTSSVGFTGNFNYTYNQRYFVDGSFRFDGSSQFGTNNRFAPFYSLGVGWNLHKENFMRSLGIFNELRLKYSIGESGSQQFSPYQARSMFNFTSDSRYLFWTSSALMGLGNEDLTWQTTKQHNFGIECSMFNTRVKFACDVYRKKTNNLLSTIAIPMAYGFNSYTDNIGSTKNYGFEASLGLYLVRNTERAIFWNVTGRIAHNRDKIVKLSEEIKRQTADRLKYSEYGDLLYEGRSQNCIYAVRSLGINPGDGQEIFLNTEGIPTYTWDASYRIYCGEAQPTYRGTLSSLFNYKELSLNISFAYHWGGYAYNNTLLNKVEMPTGVIEYGGSSAIKQNLDKRVVSARWQKPGDIKFFKGYSQWGTKASTRFVMADKVFQLQSVNIAYRWNTDFVKRTLKAESFNLSVNMSDLLYLSTIKRERGTSYPFARNVQLSLSVIF